MEKFDKISKIHWLHSIELEPGFVTPGIVPLAHLSKMTDDLGLPQDMSGLTVLDVGARDGFFSFEAEKRGARVIAVDIQSIDTIGLRVARDILQSRVEFVQSNVYDLTLEKIGGEPVDVIFFLGVMYHLRHPLLAIDNLWNLLKPNGTIYVETAYLDEYFVVDDAVYTSLESIHPILSRTALLQYYPNDELNPGDFSNWFSPNQKALEEILRSAGFEPQLLSKWGGRILYKAAKLEGTPQYMLSEHGADPLSSRWAGIDPRDVEMRRKNRHFVHVSGDAREKVRSVLGELRSSKIYKAIRLLGFWSALDKKIEELLLDHR